MATRFLTDSERRTGQKRLGRAELLNGFASIFLGDTFVFLLAARFGAGNLMLGLISSGIYVAGLALPILMRLCEGRNEQRCHAFCWLMRGVCSLGYLSLFFLDGQGALAALGGTYALFCVFRSLGIVFHDTAARNVSTVQNRGEVLSRVNAGYQAVTLLAKLAGAVITGIRAIPALAGIIGIQMAGVATNVLSSVEYGRIPCRRTVRRGGTPLWTMAKTTLRRGCPAARPLWLKALYTGVLILVQMAVPFLSNAVGLGPNLVLVYSLVAAVGMTLSGVFGGFFSDKVGAKPLIIINTILLAAAMVVWMLLPPTVPFVAFFILGFFANFFVNSICLMTGKMVALVTPEDDDVGFNSFANFLIAIVALVCGAGAGWAVDLGDAVVARTEMAGLALGSSYSFCFLAALLLCAVGIWLAAPVKEKGSLPAGKAVGALFTMHGLRAFSVIDRIGKTRDPLKRRILLMALGANLANVATSEIKMKLASPFSLDKAEIIRALGDCPRQALVGDLARIALNDDSFVQLDAIAALGSYTSSPLAKETLVRLLDSQWGSSRSMASKSLSRFPGSEAYLERVDSLSRSARHIDEEIDFLVAKKRMDKEGLFYQNFFLPVRKRRSPAYRQTRYALLASFLRFGSPRLAHLYELMNIGSVEDFLQDFLPEARDLEEIDAGHEALAEAFRKGDKELIIDFCMRMVRRSDVDFDPHLRNLKLGLLSAERIGTEEFDTQDLLAMLYFGYSLRKVSDNPPSFEQI